MVPYVLTAKGLNVYLGEEMKSVGQDHNNYEAIVEMLRDPEASVEEVTLLVDIVKSVEKFGDGHIVITGDEVTYDGRLMHNALTEKMLVLLKEQRSVAVLVNFMTNLMENPSERAVNETYGFLEASKLPLTNDGHFLAYKKVRFDFKDLHSNTMDNSIGKEVSMPRNAVDENSNNTCSNGLHCASFGYMSSYGGTGNDTDDRLVIVKVNPRDVVAVPSDYNNQKMRVCKYTVVDELPNDGFAELKDVIYGDRTSGFLRDLLKIVKITLQDSLNLKEAPKYNASKSNFKLATVPQVDEVLTTLKDAYKLGCEITTYTDEFKHLNVRSLLKWVTKYSK